jgi:hypothetical protein
MSTSEPRSAAVELRGLRGCSHEMRSLIALAAAAAALLGALRPADGAPAAGLHHPVGVVGCAEHVEAGSPGPSTEEIREARRSSFVVGAVTLWGLRRAQGHAFGPNAAHGMDGWKGGISVRGYRSVTLRVAARDRRWLALDYVRRPADRRLRQIGDGDSAVRFEPCRPGTRSFIGRPMGPETGWAGGFIVVRGGCATLLVRRAGAQRSTLLRVGFGVPCR